MLSFPEEILFSAGMASAEEHFFALEIVMLALTISIWVVVLFDFILMACLYCGDVFFYNGGKMQITAGGTLDVRC